MGKLVQISDNAHRLLSLYKAETGIELGVTVESALAKYPSFLKKGMEHGWDLKGLGGEQS